MTCWIIEENQISSLYLYYEMAVNTVFNLHSDFVSHSLL
jgi:hypothetical protein